MDATLANQITSLEEARALITELRNEFQQSLAALQTENQLLRKKLELFLQRYFGGTKNESLDPKQLELLLAGLTAVSAPTPVAEQQTPARVATAVRPVRQPLPAHLETERVVLEPVEVQQQPAGWRKLGEEVTE
jgi:hypothetical protein